MLEKRELVETLKIFGNNLQANLHTSTVAKITAVNEKTINCTPVVPRLVNGATIQLPEFVEVPVVFFRGGASYTTYPIAEGDSCLLIFCERSFDKWYAGQDFELPVEYRMHDYSDGFAICGISPQDSELTIPDEITQNGDTTQNGNYTHTGNTTQTGDYTLTGDMTINGNLQVNGNITCTGNVSAGSFSGLNGGDMTTSSNIITTQDVVASGISLNSHVHVKGGGQSTEGPS